MQVRPFSQACENNKNPIYSVLEPHLKELSHIVEIGSGTAQHACYFTEQMPHLTWQTTDQGEYFQQLQTLLKEQESCTLPQPLYLDVTQEEWPISDCQCVFTANTLHIMSWSSVKCLFANIANVLNADGKLFIYGPFNYNGKFTSASNEAFDAYIKEWNPHSGIRDNEKVVALAEKAGLNLITDYEMPANNHLLHFAKK